jgi:hypothetical protein
MKRKMTTSSYLILLLALATPAWAQPQASSTASGSEASHVLVFLAGAATGLVVHESGHVLFSAAFGANPRVRGIKYGPLPFFAIVHDGVTRRQEFVISSAGFWMQHAGSEWLLSERPRLRDERAPFLKGLLAFNLAASAVYATAGLGRFGPPERDTRGMAVSLGDDGVPEPVVGLLVLGPAVLDGYRYLQPDASWAKWASRSVKIAMVVLTVAAGR